MGSNTQPARKTSAAQNTSVLKSHVETLRTTGKDANKKKDVEEFWARDGLAGNLWEMCSIHSRLLSDKRFKRDHQKYSVSSAKCKESFKSLHADLDPCGCDCTRLFRLDSLLSLSKSMKKM